MANLEQNAVGEKIYVWTKSPGRPSPDAFGRCIITSHGAQSIINSKFPVRNVKLIFYCPHGYTLIDPGLEEVMKGEKRSTETVDAGTCQDYVLSKYQQKSGGPRVETYQTIARMPDRLAALKRGWGSAIEHAIKMEDPRALNNAISLWNKTDDWKDIVTVRNRKWPPLSEPLLSEVIAELHGAGYRYKEFHCVFCRGPQLELPWKPAPEHSPPWAP